MARLDVTENDQTSGVGTQVNLLSSPLVGTAWVDGSSIYYAASEQPARDVFVYELEFEGERSFAVVDVSVLAFEDPAVAGDLPVIGQPTPAQVADRLEYIPVDPARPDIQALVPLAYEILDAYGNPTSDIDRARAIRDWVARTAIHPYPPLHPDGSTANLAVLPTQTTWADVNRLDGPKVNSDSRYWSEVHFSGYAMLDRLLGTLDPATGVRANDGLMERVGLAHYRIRDIEEYKYVLCSYQDVIAISLWGALGIQGVLLSTYGHDPAAVFIPELRKWVYQDPTYNEEFTVVGEDEVLSPLDLLAISLAGRQDKLIQRKMLGPAWSPDIYIDARLDERATYFGDGHPYGMNRMGTQLNNAIPAPGFRLHLSQIRLPDLELPFSDETKYKQTEPGTVFPRPGTRVTYILQGHTQVEIGVESTHPSLVSFERSIDNEPWQEVVLPDIVDYTRLQSVGSTVSYRSLDPYGRAGMAVSVLISPPLQDGPAVLMR